MVYVSVYRLLCRFVTLGAGVARLKSWANSYRYVLITQAGIRAVWLLSGNATYRSEVHREVTPVKPRVGHHMAKWIGSAVSQRVLFATQNLGTDLPVFEFKCPRRQCLMIREQRSHSPCRAFLAGHIPPGPAGWGETIPTFLSQ